MLLHYFTLLNDPSFYSKLALSFPPTIDHSLSYWFLNEWDTCHWFQELRVIFGRVMLDIDVDVYDNKYDDKDDYYGNGTDENDDENEDDAYYCAI